MHFDHTNGSNIPSSVYVVLVPGRWVILYCIRYIRVDKCRLPRLGYGVTAAAVIEGAASQEAFVFKGLRTLAMAPVRKLTSSNQESIQYRDVTECKVYCNGKSMKTSVCVGRTEVAIENHAFLVLTDGCGLSGELLDHH